MDQMKFESGPIESFESLMPALREVFTRHDVDLAYLYGSQARGDTGPLSDVDVAVLFSSDISKSERFEQQLLLIGELMSIFKRSDVFMADLDDASPLLRHRVSHDGIVLYCTDDKIRVQFMTEALRDYVDTKPLRKIQLHYLVQRAEEGTFGRVRKNVTGDKESHG